MRGGENAIFYMGHYSKGGKLMIECKYLILKCGSTINMTGKKL